MSSSPLTRLIVVRHGETEWNAEGRLMNQLDSPLTPAGLAGAEALALRLRSVPAAALYTSDLGRALRTAQCIAACNGLDPIHHPGLRERHLGTFAGHLRDELETVFPEEYARYRSDPDYVVPEGESFRQFFNRTVAAFQEIAAAHWGETVIVVTHGGCLDCLFRHVSHMPLDVPRAVRLPNTGVNVFEVQRDRWFLLTWGDTSHGIESSDDVF